MNDLIIKKMNEIQNEMDFVYLKIIELDNQIKNKGDYFIFISDIYGINAQQLNLEVYNDELKTAIKKGYETPNKKYVGLADNEILRITGIESLDFLNKYYISTSTPETLFNSDFNAFFIAYKSYFLQFAILFGNYAGRKEDKNEDWTEFMDIYKKIDYQMQQKHKEDTNDEITQIKGLRNELINYFEFLNSTYDFMIKKLQTAKKMNK